MLRHLLLLAVFLILVADLVNGQSKAKIDNHSKSQLVVEKNVLFAQASKIENLYLSDTLDARLHMKKMNHKIDSIQQSLYAKIDSIKYSTKPDTILIKALTNLNVKADSIKMAFSSLSKQIKPGAVDKTMESVNASLNKVAGAANEKLSLFNKNGARGLPGSISTTSLSTALPLLGIPTMKGTNIADVNISAENFPGKLLPEISKNGVEIPQIKTNILSPIQNIDGYAEASDIEKQAIGYQSNIKNIESYKIDDIPKELEDKVSGVDQVSGLKKEIDHADQLKRFYDPEVAKEEALIKAKQEAINHFAGHEEELKLAMTKLSGLKSKFPDAEGTLDLFSKRQKLMKGKSFAERLVPALTFQLQKRTAFYLDLNPHVAFKISYRWLAGLGWNERFGYDFDHKRWDHINRVYGLRSFIHFKIKENFWLKANIENFNVPIRKYIIQSDDQGRQWLWNYFIGIKRDFQFSEKVKANVQMLYNVYNPKQNPYSAKFNVLLGFEIGVKKKCIKREKL